MSTTAASTSTHKRKATTEPRAYRVGDRVRRTVDGIIGLAQGTLGVVTTIGEWPGVWWEGKTTSMDACPFSMELVEEEESTKKAKVEEPEAAPAAAAAADGIEWMVATGEAYHDIELVQEDIACGIKCCKIDLVRLRSEFLDTLLECANKEKLTRVTIANGVCTSRKVMYDLFMLVAWIWPNQSKEIDTDDGELLQLLHAANALALWDRPSIQKLRDSLLARDVPVASGSELLELLEAAKRYHWKELTEAVAKRLRRMPSVTLTDAQKLLCCDYWRD